MRLSQSQLENYNRKLAIANAVHRVPPEFQPKQLHHYPTDNHHEFERWFKDNTTPVEIAGKDRTYLPILWTGYWCNNGYGVKDKVRNRLQLYVDSLPRNKKYFTICQYDDGCMINFKDLDIKIFGMSGGRIDYPIPLLCLPHKFEFPEVKKDIFCSFVGAETHPIRKEMIKQLAGKEGYYITTKKMPLADYCKILARSVFALAPRGYGRSSFRVAEAIHYGAVPIYVSDEFIWPYNEEFPGISCQVTDLPCCIPHDFTLLQQQVSEQKVFYTYEGCKQKILENI